MQHLKVSGAVRPLKWSLGVKWLIESRICSARCVPHYNPSVKVSSGGDTRAIAEASVPNDCLH